MKKSINRDCYCALCRSPRTLRYRRHLSPLQYSQIALLTAVVTWIFYPWFELKALASFFIFWGGFELAGKLLYRRELKCLNCGFDPTWYRKDVRVARRHVETFLQEHPDSPVLRAKKSHTRSQEEISQ